MADTKKASAAPATKAAVAAGTPHQLPRSGSAHSTMRRSRW